ncbi:MAG: PEP-CTERM sorting domain-containing protein [Alphaproteobacteria bacterium]|nr:PEP-CTERM sorting domain-containing protein [Alphaproteobacteria bacterium]
MINSSSRSAEFQVAQFQGVRTQVSEPGSLAILAVGLLGLGIAARRRRV